MTNCINDPIFGLMEYKHSWNKKETISFWNKKYTVNITAQAYKGDDILEEQRNCYNEFNTKISKIAEDAVSEIIKYCELAFQTKGLKKPDIISALTPATVLFQRDNTWGILFNCIWDEEHGIALLVDNNNIKIGAGDIIL